MMAAHISGMRVRSGALAALPGLKAVFQKALGRKIPSHKPILGDAIFEVESGIHVDGILKNPVNYEPFPPELLHAARSIRIGKHSGEAAVKVKLAEYGIFFDSAQIGPLLKKVRESSIRLGRGLADAEFVELAETFACGT
jgi:homocitrate synthase NifV